MLNHKEEQSQASKVQKNIVTDFFEKMQLTGLVKDHEDKYSFVFDDNIEVDVLLERRYLYLDTVLCTLPIKLMTKERILSDLAKHCLFDIKEHDICFYIDTKPNTVNGYQRISVDQLTEAVFEEQLSRFLNVVETYKHLMEKILRMGELSDIPVEFRLD